MKWFVLNLAFLLSISQLLSVSSDDPTATPTPTSAPTPAPTPTPAPAPAPAAVVVPECPYEAAENGSLICPEVKSGGAIPKLMQCANKVKNEFANICKNKPSEQIMEKVKAQCLDVCIMPCVPPSVVSLLIQCGKLEDLNNAKVFNIDAMCDEKKLKEAKECGIKLFKEHKSEYMQIFNKRIHNLCKQCNDFHTCFSRIMKESAGK